MPPRKSDYTNNIETSEYYTTNIVVCSIIGIAVKLLFGNNYSKDGSNGPASSVLWGYGLVTIAIFFLIFVQVNQYLKTNLQTPTLASGAFRGVFLKILPTLFMFIILAWIVTMNFQFYKQINTGDLAGEYKEFSNMSTVMIIFQLIVLIKYIELSKNGNSETAESKKFANISYIIAILNFVFIAMMNIIIVSYTTDG